MDERQLRASVESVKSAGYTLKLALKLNAVIRMAAIHTQACSLPKRCRPHGHTQHANVFSNITLSAITVVDLHGNR
jgi:hypothetical protein